LVLEKSKTFTFRHKYIFVGLVWKCNLVHTDYLHCIPTESAFLFLLIAFGPSKPFVSGTCNLLAPITAYHYCFKYIYQNITSNVIDSCRQLERCCTRKTYNAHRGDQFTFNPNGCSKNRPVNNFYNWSEEIARNGFLFRNTRIYAPLSNLLLIRISNFNYKQVYRRFGIDFDHRFSLQFLLPGFQLFRFYLQLLSHHGFDFDFGHKCSFHGLDF